jgi:hypothetical protein
MIEEDIRIAIDTFNRFRRPDVEARLVSMEENTAVVEFLSAGAVDIKQLADSLKHNIESATKAPVTAVTRKRGSTNMTKFTVAKDHGEEENPIDRALRIMDKYNEGTDPKFAMED